MKPKKPHTHDPELILRAEALFIEVSKMTNISKARLLSPSRLAQIVHARSLILYTLVESGFSYSELGKLFSRDHSTIIYNYKTTLSRLTNPEIQDNKLKKALKHLREVNNKITEKVLFNEGNKRPT